MDKDTKLDILNRIENTKKIFKGTQYQELLDELDLLLQSNDEDVYDKVKEILVKFPTDEGLLEFLIEKLKGKPAYKTLKKISEGKITNKYEILKGLFSLGTHVCIECKESREYRQLLPVIYRKISNILYNLFIISNLGLYYLCFKPNNST